MAEKQIAVINGPNLNLLGFREEEYYGNEALEEIERRIEGIGRANNLKIVFFQSNSESDIVNFIQENGEKLTALILNPAGLSKTGYCIWDAIRAYKLPYIEVHLSNIFAREKWHSESIFLEGALGHIIGLKGKGYDLAISALIYYLKEKEEVH